MPRHLAYTYQNSWRHSLQDLVAERKNVETHPSGVASSYTVIGVCQVLCIALQCCLWRRIKASIPCENIPRQ